MNACDRFLLLTMILLAAVIGGSIPVILGKDGDGWALFIGAVVFFTVFSSLFILEAKD